MQCRMCSPHLLKQPAQRQGYIITLLYSAETPVRQQTRQIRAAYGDRLPERAGEEESLQLKPVGQRQMFYPTATLLSGDRCLCKCSKCRILLGCVIIKKWKKKKIGQGMMRMRWGKLLSFVLMDRGLFPLSISSEGHGGKLHFWMRVCFFNHVSFTVTCRGLHSKHIVLRFFLLINCAHVFWLNPHP